MNISDNMLTASSGLNIQIRLLICNTWVIVFEFRGATTFLKLGDQLMASAVAQACNGGLGASCAPRGVQGQSPWSEGQGAKPPEADDIFALECQIKQ